MKIQHFINGQGKVNPNTKTAGVKTKFSEKKEPTKIVRTYTIS